MKMPRIVRDEPRLTVFFFVYYVGLLAYGFATGNAQAPFYAVFLGLGAAIVAAIHSRHPLTSLVMWLLAVWGFAHMVGGLVVFGGEVVYERSLGAGELRFDKLVHFFGFGAATLAAYEVLRDSIAPDAPARSVAIAALFVGLGIGAVNETIEFLITRLPGESNVGGFSNTGWDLVANALGAVAASVSAPFLERGRT